MTGPTEAPAPDVGSPDLGVVNPAPEQPPQTGVDDGPDEDLPVPEPGPETDPADPTEPDDVSEEADETASDANDGKPVSGPTE